MVHYISNKGATNAVSPISRLKTTNETAANTFRGCFARKMYTARELPTHVSQFVLFSFKYILSQENPFDFVILPNLA